MPLINEQNNFTVRRYAERSIAMASRPSIRLSVRDVEECGYIVRKQLHI